MGWPIATCGYKNHSAQLPFHPTSGQFVLLSLDQPSPNSSDRNLSIPGGREGKGGGMYIGY